MTLEVNPTDKFLAGVHHSFTITSDEGLPQGEVFVGENQIPARVIPLHDPKYKISFKVPAETEGQALRLRVNTALSELEQTMEITAD